MSGGCPNKGEVPGGKTLESKMKEPRQLHNVPESKQMGGKTDSLK